MVKNINKKGFTLVEAMIAMFIISIVLLGALPVLSKAKPQIENTTIRGQFGCWWRGERLYQQQALERTVGAIEDRTSQGFCQLNLNNRPAHFYVIAAGAGIQDRAGVPGIPGQVKALYTNEISNDTKIIPGKTTPGTQNYDATTVISGTSIAANGARSNVKDGLAYSKLDVIPANVKSCRLKSTGTCAKSCEIVNEATYNDVTKSYEQIPSVRFNGCEDVDDFGNPKARMSNLLNVNVTEMKSAGVNINNITRGNLTKLSAVNNNQRYYTADGFEFYLDFHDSMYTPSAFSFGHSGTSRETNASKMADLLNVDKYFSQRRDTKITKLLRGETVDGISIPPPGAMAPLGDVGHNGAVFIMW